jgi:hypothetical protein
MSFENPGGDGALKIRQAVSDQRKNAVRAKRIGHLNHPQRGFQPLLIVLRWRALERLGDRQVPGWRKSHLDGRGRIGHHTNTIVSDLILPDGVSTGRRSGWMPLDACDQGDAAVEQRKPRGRSDSPAGNS